MHVSITKNCSVSYENYKASGVCVTILWNTYGVNDSYVILTTAQGRMHAHGVCFTYNQYIAMAWGEGGGATSIAYFCYEHVRPRS